MPHRQSHRGARVGTFILYISQMRIHGPEKLRICPSQTALLAEPGFELGCSESLRPHCVNNGFGGRATWPRTSVAPHPPTASGDNEHAPCGCVGVAPRSLRRGEQLGCARGFSFISTGIRFPERLGGHMTNSCCHPGNWFSVFISIMKHIKGGWRCEGDTSIVEGTKRF